MMTDNDDMTNDPGERRAVDAIAMDAKRKLKAREQDKRSVWFGFGMFGLVGWAVAVPTLIGIALGAYIDARGASEMSWTLALLLAGVALGCANAWYWVSRESRDD